MCKNTTAEAGGDGMTSTDLDRINDKILIHEKEMLTIHNRAIDRATSTIYFSVIMAFLSQLMSYHQTTIYLQVLHIVFTAAFIGMAIWAFTSSRGDYKMITSIYKDQQDRFAEQLRVLAAEQEGV